MLCSRACANVYSPHTGLSSMVLQRSQGRTGHMINNISFLWKFGSDILDTLSAVLKTQNFTKNGS